jgi:hypothetical protein
MFLGIYSLMRLLSQAFFPSFQPSLIPSVVCFLFFIFFAMDLPGINLPPPPPPPDASTAYVPGGLVANHWPKWDVHAKTIEVVNNWAWIQGVRYKVGEYDTKMDAFPVSITEYANSTVATTSTRIYIPARYRPIFRLLQAKISWHQIAYSMPAPLVKNGKKTGDALREEIRRKYRYEVWIDGTMRNIIYCNSIRDSFFHWIEDTYYRGANATGIRPSVQKMSREPRCWILENWLMHEFIILGHTDLDVTIWKSDPTRVERWDNIKNVFNLSKL